MQYRQITSGERYAIAALRRQGLSSRAIAARPRPRALDDLARGRDATARAEARYRAVKADSERTRAQAPRSRRNAQFGAEEWALVEQLLALDWSPEQVAGWLARHELLVDQPRDHLPARLARQARRRGAVEAPAPGGQEAPQTLRRLRLAAADSQASATSPSGRRRSRTRGVVGHWEIDTVKGADHGRHSVVTLVERATGYTVMGKLARTAPPTPPPAASSSSSASRTGCGPSRPRAIRFLSSSGRLSFGWPLPVQSS